MKPQSAVLEAATTGEGSYAIKKDGVLCANGS
jgi:hypothetical protein